MKQVFPQLFINLPVTAAMIGGIIAAIRGIPDWGLFLIIGFLSIRIPSWINL
jgi:hypothetical protein